MMSRWLILAMLFCCACASDSQFAYDQAAVNPRAESQEEVETGTWIYFSQYTFVNSDFHQGMKTPNVKRKLTVSERKMLDSLIADPPVDTNDYPKLGCYWPKHGVEIVSDRGTISVNVCFECNSSRSSDGGLNKVSMKTWEVFFGKLAVPVRTGYSEYFSNARLDSAFRARYGTFRF